MITNITDDFDEESQDRLQGLSFLDFSQLQEGYENIDALDEISGNTSFNDITNEMALESPLKKRSAFYKPSYEDDDIDFQKLTQLILGRKDVEFNWKTYIGYKTVTVTRNYSFGEDAKFDRLKGLDTSISEEKKVKTEVPLKEENLLGEHVLRLKGRLNKEVNIVNIKKDNDTDLTSGLEFEFDYEYRKVSYKLHYYYIDRKRVYERNNKNNIAFTISTSHYEDFESLLNLCELNYTEDSSFKKQITNAFTQAINRVNKLENSIPNSHERLNGKKFGQLEWLYNNTPTFVARQLDFDQTMLNVFQLSGWDDSLWYYDTTESIITILSRLDPNDVYSYFYENPQSIIELLNEFDDDALIESFCQYLTVVTLYKKGEESLEGARTFNLNEDTHIESNILFGDPSGKVELVNEKQRPTLPYPYIGINLINLFLGDIEVNNSKKESNLFHPLDLIYISRYDEVLEEEVKIPTIALYAKYIGDKGEWADVLTATFAVIDLVSIVLSGGALAAGVRGIARVFAIIDISVSTVNLVLLSPEVKKALSKTEAGKWFVAHWPLISFCVGSGMISVYLAKGILKHGSRLRTQIKNNEALTKNIDELLDESKKVVGEISELGLVSGRGRRLGQRLTKSNLNGIEKFLKTHNVDFEIHSFRGSENIKGFFVKGGKPARMPERAAAIFITDGKNMKIVLREGATVYEFLHEFMHFRHSKKIGLQTYFNLGGYGTPGEVIKEKWVFEKLLEQKEYLTKSELTHAIDYLNDKPFNRNGINPIDFQFDINKIPSVRKEIKIKELLYIK
nr:zincin-like metallopeptidase toxin domain-containing protein [uncultured Psychroserpens sp.]